MENLHTQEVLRHRSSQASIAAGYKAFFHHFRPILRATWLVAVGYAVLMAVAQKLCQWSTLWLSVHPDSDSLTFVWPLVVAVVLCWLAEIAFTGSTLGLQREHFTTQTISQSPRWTGRFNRHAIWRTAKAYLSITLISAVAMALVVVFGVVGSQHFGHITVLCTTLLLLVVVLLLLLPFAFSGMRYVLVDGTKLKSVFGRDYLTGLRRIGSLFATWLLTTLVSGSVMIIVALPALILLGAGVVSQMGMAIGDPSGMPDYMAWMSFVAYLCMGFVGAYVKMSVLFPFYYLFGSIEKKEEEKCALR